MACYSCKYFELIRWTPINSTLNGSGTKFSGRCNKEIDDVVGPLTNDFLISQLNNHIINGEVYFKFGKPFIHKCDVNYENFDSLHDPHLLYGCRLGPKKSYSVLCIGEESQEILDKILEISKIKL